MLNTSKKAGRGSLALIALFFLLSAGIRLGTSANEAWAAAEDPVPKDEPEVAEEGPAEGPTEQHMRQLLAALQERERRATQREEEIAARAMGLAEAKKEIEKQLVHLEQAEKRLSATIARAQTASEDDVARLTAVYENMKPKDAAKLFETMEPDFAAGFLARMKPEIAAAVMAGLDPQVAYSVSVILAGRNADVPKE